MERHRIWSVLLLTSSLAACQHVMQTTQLTPTSGPRAEFDYRRTHSPAGIFLDSTQLSTWSNTSLSDVLQLRLAGFRSRRATPSSVSPASSCDVDVYVDGSRTSGNVDDLRVRDIAGVEYYDGAVAPLKYQRPGRNCPVLLLWLRH